MAKFGRFLSSRIIPGIQISSHLRISTTKSERHRIYGQPHPTTHGHILTHVNDVNRGFTPDVFYRRRENLANLIIQQQFEVDSKDHLVVIHGSTRKFMVDKIPYFFRQNSNFRYLSGCLQPDCVLIMHINSSSGLQKSILFLQDNNQHEERWEGARTPPSLASDFFGVNESYSISQMPEYLLQHNGKQTNLWLDQPDKFVSPTQTFKNPSSLIHSLRSVKCSKEISLMREGCEVASQAIKSAMCCSLETESAMQGHIDYMCRLSGASYPAYPAVVACGTNATTIHYINNDSLLSPDQMVLVDAGCDWNGYASDISRTWPISSRFSSNQRLLYEIVLDVQSTLIDTLRSGEVFSLNALYQKMLLLIGLRLSRDLSISSTIGHDDESLMRWAKLFCPHNVGHHLGIDVHDSSLLSKDSALQPGNVITIEPGIYIPLNMPGVEPQWHGIGIRIEDDILIDSNERIEVLTKSCPKVVEDIEALTSNRRLPY